MKTAWRLFSILTACWLAAASSAVAMAQEVDPGAEPVPVPTAPLRYSSFFPLVGEICTEAASAFNGFFDSSPVQVRPFVHIGGAANDDSSLLGVVLADQMAAMLNGHANAHYGTAAGGNDDRQQLLEGVLQEMNGYLRIHMHATNQHGVRRSHVVLVEISAAVYRALHSYIEPR
jgi:hypothetical protein